jgi:hypothetical protein
MRYDDRAARHRQLSSGPLGGDSFRKFIKLGFARFRSVKDNRSKKNCLTSAHVLTAKSNFSSEVKLGYVRSPRTQRALAREVVSSMKSS